MTPRRRIVFLDVGGVLLSNGWDSAARRRAAARFGLDRRAFERRHQFVVADLETGRMSLDEYLDRVIFHEPRGWSAAEVRAFMLSQSKARAAALRFARALAASPDSVLIALNNESRELNEYRIETFGLHDIFTAFFSSCYLGVAKPSVRIFRLALDLVQAEPDSCVFVDDREVNLEAARRTGIRTIHHRNLTGLRADLDRAGIRVPAAPGRTTKKRSKSWKSE